MWVCDREVVVLLVAIVELLVVCISLSPARDLGPDAGAKSIRARFPACRVACCSSYLRFWSSAFSIHPSIHTYVRIRGLKSFSFIDRNLPCATPVARQRTREWGSRVSN